MRRLALVALMLSAVGCLLLTNTEDRPQACDSRDACLIGFFCVEGVCVRSEGDAGRDAGAPAVQDAGDGGRSADGGDAG